MITLATLEQSTAQEVFDQVSNHLLTQMKKSYDKLGFQCAYKSSNGNRCAAGCLISDDEYKSEMEGKDWVRLVDLEVTPQSHKDLIIKLQFIHDADDPKDWAYKLEELSKELDLSFNHVEL